MVALSLYSAGFESTDAFVPTSNVVPDRSRAATLVAPVLHQSQPVVDGESGGPRRAPSSVDSVRRRPPSSSSVTPSPREPAGVESIFAILKMVRRRATARILTRSGRGGERGNRSRRSESASSSFGILSVDYGTADSSIDIRCLDEIVSGFPPEISSALRGPDEGRRLAAMKVLLEDDLRAMRERIVNVPSDDVSTVKSVDIISAYPDAYGDFRLLRFLRKDRDQDPVSASLHFREYVSWRRDSKIDDIRARIGENPWGYIPEDIRTIEQYFPCNFDLGNGLGDGCPPVLLTAGQWDTAGLTKAIRTKADGITLDKFLEYWVYVYEYIHLRLYENSMKLGSVVYIDEICDLKGLGLRQFSPAFISQVLKPWLAITQANYPETARRIFFFEPPKVMDIIWRLVTPMVNERTVSKVQFRRGYDGSSLDFIQNGETAQVTNGPSDDNGNESNDNQEALYA
eukprot:CAMPEP_0113544760 /NCGR_PEP_ID=MMETSP0015_2-20120614/10882_1 /TAXON_ID=2838 /ORGANISM="Odontella" /LENGTH=456 /DNA_ID=CAMNT_0000445045 /DNA_START=417 /DNA_END=1787 /DNA_ORIENTATION=+ /assembly_acc=CAM_ASM_000160